MKIPKQENGLYIFVICTTVVFTILGISGVILCRFKTRGKLQCILIIIKFVLQTHFNSVRFYDLIIPAIRLTHVSTLPNFSNGYRPAAFRYEYWLHMRVTLKSHLGKPRLTLVFKLRGSITGRDRQRSLKQVEPPPLPNTGVSVTVLAPQKWPL